ncbi:protein-disulfide reductase DsbD [Alloalcanivorax venustensis]|uniref:protein-disulfide reductase DsbD n=1 Tax=Alloalcanivorax venustensis TaxID=172371 RepID=UPI003C5EB435
MALSAMQRSVSRVLQCSRWQKRGIMMITDALILPLLLWGAYALRFSTLQPVVHDVWLFPAAALISVAMLYVCGFYRSILRYLGSEAAWSIVTGMAASVITLAAMSYMVPAEVPRSIFVIYWLLGTMYLGASRFLARRFLFRVMAGYLNRERVAVFGAGLNLQFLLQQPAAILTSVVIFVLLALSMFGLYELQLPERLRNRLNNAGPNGRGGLGGAVLMGVISALVVSPCVTPILAGALLYVAGTGDAVTGAASLFALALGMGVPLIIFGTGGGHFLPRAGQWMEDIKRFFGVVMLGVAIWLLDRIVSDTLTLAFYGLLLAVYGVQLGALEPVREGGSRLKRGLALVLALYGAIMVVGAAGGGSDPWQPLKPLTQPQTESSGQAGGDNTAATADDGQHGPWIDVDGRQGLRDALARSADADKPVLVDFFAEWCVACKVMEDTTLSDPRVLDAMAGYDLYRVDITEINQENQNIMADYDIFGLPSFVFFAPDGEEVPESRVLGEMDSERFLKHLERRVTPHL